MESIASAHTALEKKGNLSKTISDVQTLIDQIQKARDAMAETPEQTPLHMAKLRQPVKASFDKIEEDLKEVNKGLNQYQKALKEKFKSAQLPSAETNILGNQTALVNRAIAMHLLREGSFDVATQFVREVNEQVALDMSVEEAEGGPEIIGMDSWLRDFSMDPDAMDEDDDYEDEDGELSRTGIQRKFREMYIILVALRNNHNLEPAISWARNHSDELSIRGSNLEFELCRLKYIQLYTAQLDPSNPLSGPIHALEYARKAFPAFDSKHIAKILPLGGSLAFPTGLDDSPYASAFMDPSIYGDVAEAFTREFCGMLGLASSSPLFTAVTAGGISLPILEKVERVMAQSRGQWTSVNELPVETPLPPNMVFHSIFVCPVSKEQATDANPPMLLPCGHVIAKESLEMHARGKSRMKCPYCPSESHPRDAKRVYI